MNRTNSFKSQVSSSEFRTLELETWNEARFDF
jgi:hypothetical protein